MRFSETDENIKLLKLGVNRGKGGAIKRGVQAALGQRILMVSSLIPFGRGLSYYCCSCRWMPTERRIYATWRTCGSLSTRSKSLQPTPLSLLSALPLGAGLPLCPPPLSSPLPCGRAHMEGKSIATRALHRTILMYGFHILVMLLCTRNVKDTQCGFKLFTRHAAREIFRQLHLERWSFDTEVIFLAESLSFPLIEVSPPCRLFLPLPLKLCRWRSTGTRWTARS
jgi:dolichyl-phosphate beta-glucosyltransferase